MCGIAAIYAYRDDAPPVDASELRRINDAMAPRGPDGACLWSHERIGLAHRRLAIIDVREEANQPMCTQNGRLWITFNGEIYNYQSIRTILKQQGYAFRTQSDTEVLLHLYDYAGIDCLRYLRGMYAFALWDAREQTLVLARDPLGIKPLYYADDGKTIRVASQVKALLAGGMATTPNPDGHAGFLRWGFVPDPHTLYREIQAVPAGTCVVVKRDKSPQSKQMFDVTDILESVLPAENNNRLPTIVRESVQAHLVSDVPIGVFLSSGIDSCTVASLMRELGADFHTITIGFKEFRGTPQDEVPLAERVAKNLGTKHTTVWIHSSDIDHQTILESMDQPSADGVNMYLAAQAAKQAGLKVALSGIGGDELFAGYEGLNRRIRTMSYLLDVPSAYAVCRSFTKELSCPVSLLDAVGSIPSLRAQITALECQWYLRHQLLRDADWAGMAHGVEIRTPLIDWTLFCQLAPMLVVPHPPTKQDWARTPAMPLPQEILTRTKTGFLVPRWQASRDRARMIYQQVVNKEVSYA